jgi:hypothetical protein
LIAAYEQKTPDSYLRELLKASSVNSSAQSSPCPRRHLAFEEETFCWGIGDSTDMEGQQDGEDEDEPSAPPPYTLNDFPKIELGDVTFCETLALQTHQNTEFRTSVTIREVDRLGESATSSPDIDLEIRSRGCDRKERYGGLIRKPRQSRRFSDESIEKRVKLTVAQMTQNLHIVASSEDSWDADAASTKKRDQHDFETDEMEVWNSIIMGIRTLQEVCGTNVSKTLTC